jgi:hypothetical protein
VSASAVAYGFIEPPAARFDLTVLDEAGRSVPFAKVSLVSTRSFLGVTQQAQYSAETARDGHLSIDAVQHGRLQVQVIKSGFDDYFISYRHTGSGSAEVRLRTTPGGQEFRGVEVIVSDSLGAPLQDATVVVSGERKGRPFNFEAIADARGRTLFPFATPGLVLVSVRKGGRVPYDRAFLTQEADRLAIQLE